MSIMLTSHCPHDPAPAEHDTKPADKTIVALTNFKPQFTIHLTIN
jgi:hypothetical protein